MSVEKLSVQLFHGRSHPDEKLDDWGFGGPCLGPLSGVHLTYGNVGVFGGEDERITLPRVDDLLFYGGQYFGDAAIRSVATQSPTAQVDERLTRVPHSARQQERLPIVLPEGLRREYLRRAEVFVDSVRELAGDRPADAVRKALLQLVSDRRRP